MKYVFMVELETNEIIGSKEQLAMALEKLGIVKITKVEEKKEG